MNGTESVRPIGNILDLWGKMMEPFEAGEGGNQEKDTTWRRRRESK